MQRAVSSFIGAVILVMFLVTTVEAADPSAERVMLPREEFDELFARVDNSGRWGKQDERGTLNLITAKVRKAAAREATDGVSVSLAREISADPTDEVSEPAKIEFMQAPDSLLGPADDSVMWTVERITLLFHGFAHTHVDAPSHMSYQGRTFNAPAAHSESLEPERNHIGSMRDGVVARGLLVDLPLLRGVPFVEPGNGVTPADLEAWEQETGLRVRPGDVVLLRSGRWTAEAVAAGSSGSAGVHPLTAEWLHERGVAAFGDEGGTDLPASVVEGINTPFHVLALVAMGMPLFENLDLEAVAAEASTRSRWSFMFVAAPLDLRGATGSPINPLALF